MQAIESEQRLAPPADRTSLPLLRIEGLSKPITALIVLSSVLLVSAAGLWLWQGFQNF